MRKYYYLEYIPVLHTGIKVETGVHISVNVAWDEQFEPKEYKHKFLLVTFFENGDFSTKLIRDFSLYINFILCL